MENIARLILTGVKSFYFGERRALLQCILFITSEAQNKSDFQDIFEECLKQRLRNKLPMNLLKTLERSLDVDKEYRSYRDVGASEQDNSEGTLITNLQFELIATLQILFAIYFIQ